MRVFFGIIIGIILTVGGAYIVDSVRDTSGSEGSFNRPVVNWDVVDHSIKGASDTLRQSWERLTGHAKGD